LKRRRVAERGGLTGAPLTGGCQSSETADRMESNRGPPLLPRLHRYYEPLRHPSRPGLSLTSCQLIRTAITAGTSRVVYGLLCRHAVAPYPGRTDGICSLVLFHRLRPSPKPRRVGSCINVFEACSAFTRVTACLLTESLERPSAPEASAVSLPPPLL